MSNTKRNNTYVKWKRLFRKWLHDEVSTKEFREFEATLGVNGHYWGHGDNRPNGAKYIIQTLGHRRRRCAERMVSRDALKGFGHSDYVLCIVWRDELQLPDVYEIPYDATEYPYETELAKHFSSPWDYY